MVHLPSPIVAQNPINSFLTLLKLQDGTKAIRKVSKDAVIEAKMLAFLADYLPTAKLYAHGKDWLIMEYIGERCSVDEVEAAHTLAQMHAKPFKRFGFEYDTTIGPHRQVNPKKDSWIDFFKEARLLYMAKACLNEGKISAALFSRVETLSGDLKKYLTEPDHPSLLHGDIWGGNVLCKEGKAVYIDPAIYCGHHEMELAFITLFSTFGERFFSAYKEVMPIETGFYERKELLNLYPLLVHVRSFGGSYINQVESVLDRFGV